MPLLHQKQDIQRRIHHRRIYSQVQRYKRLSRPLKWLLPALIITALVGLFIWPHVSHFIFEQLKAKGVFSLGKIEQSGLVTSPHYQSRSKKNQPFDIYADQAMALDTQEVLLAKPRASLMLDENRKISITAEQGTYQQQQKILHLDNGVTLQDNQGNKTVFKNATLNLEGGTIKSDSPIQGTGPLGTIEADGFEANEQEQMLIFKGHAKIVIRPQEHP